MNVPTVNVIMSFDSDVISSYLNSDTLSEFKSVTPPGSEVFHLHNGPGSLFLGLTHTLGFGAAGSQNAKTPNIRLEFIDPEGIFEERMINFSIPSMIPTKVIGGARHSSQTSEAQPDVIGGETIEPTLGVDYDPSKSSTWPKWMQYGYNTQAHFDEELDLWLKGGKSESDFPEYDGTGHPSDPDRSTSIPDPWIESAGTIAADPDLPHYVLPESVIIAPEQPNFDAESAEFLRLQSQVAHQQSLSKIPVWITYGIGDNLADWAPPMQYSQLTKAEYDFKGDGARILKLEYDGVGISPELDSRFGKTMKKLTELGAGEIIRQGHSLPMFNVNINKNLLDYYTGLVSNIGDSNESFGIEGLKDYNPFNAHGLYTEDRGGPYAGTAGATADARIAGYFGTKFQFSIHQTIVDTLVSYMRGCLNEENVLVLFPDLDYALLSSYDAIRTTVSTEVFNKNWLDSNLDTKFEDSEGNSITIDEFKDGMITIEASKRFFELLGFRWTLTATAGSNVATGGISTLPFNPMMWAQKQDIVGDPAQVYKLLSSKEIRVNLIGTDIRENYYETLVNVTSRISKEINNNPPNNRVVDFEPTAYVETDAELLSILHKNKLISVGNKPAYIFGDSKFISGILMGRIFDEIEVLEPDAEKEDKHLVNILSLASSKNIPTYRISPLTSLQGLNDNYFNSLYLYRTPKPHQSPFGAMDEDLGHINEMLYKDPNIKDSAAELDGNLKRVPVFALGVKNPNILGLKFDINTIYFQYLNSFGYTGNPVQMLITGIMGEEARQVAYSIFRSMAGSPLSSTAPPWFKDIMQGYYRAADISAEAATFRDWEFAVRQLGLYDLEEFERIISGKQIWTEWEAEREFGGVPGFGGKWGDPDDYIGKPKEAPHVSDQAVVKEEFIEMMWVIFIGLFTKLPKGSKIMIDTADPGVGAISDAAKRFDKLSKLVLVGTIKTVPFFHLASVNKAILRKSLLYCTEPQISKNIGNIMGTSDNSVRSTWFSGMYIIQGFKHSIGPSRAESEFLIVRDPRLTEVVDSGT